MAEHSHASINIEYDRNSNDSTLSSKTELHKINIVTPHKKIRPFYHPLTQILYRIFQKYRPINKKIPKGIKLLKILNNIFNNIKYKKIGTRQMIMLNLLIIHQKILLISIMSQVK